MRIRVDLNLAKAVALPINYQHLLTAVVYGFLASADADYAAFLHDDGYALSDDPTDRKRFKLFVFSWLRGRRFRVRGGELEIGPGRVEWFVSSPASEFLQDFATGLLSEGALRVGRTELPIEVVETMPEPTLASGDRFVCLSPVVVSVPDIRDGKSGAHYLRPGDPEFSEYARRNLVNKHRALTGSLPDDDALEIEFSADYLARRQGTKLIDYKGTQIVGAFCPFRLSGSVELMRVAYLCGLGEKNAGGFGMVEREKGGQAKTP